MERRRMSDKQFEMLYRENIARLYRTALYLTGERVIAEQAASEAFLQTALDAGNAADLRSFALESSKRMFACCEQFAGMPYRVEEAVCAGIPQEQAELMADKTLRERALILLAMTPEFSAAKAAAILRLPVWLVRLRLRWMIESLRGEVLVQMEENLVYVSGPVGPF